MYYLYSKLLQYLLTFCIGLYFQFSFLNCVILCAFFGFVFIVLFSYIFIYVLEM